MRKPLIFLLLSLLLPFLSPGARTVHVFVALCDNVNQGIVKVPEKIGNGQGPRNNLYWGCGYGVKTFFSTSPDWKLVKTYTKPGGDILERMLFKHKSSDTYLLADAYDGAKIKQCTIDFLNAAAGGFSCNLILDTLHLSFGGSSGLVGYCGHDGLMDFNLDSMPESKSSTKRQAIILACYSKSYFTPAIKKSGASPLLWTTHLMCPEAYTIKAAIDGWILNETAAQVRSRAVLAYSKYQKCTEKAAGNLLVTGW